MFDTMFSQCIAERFLKLPSIKSKIRLNITNIAVEETGKIDIGYTFSNMHFKTYF